MKPMTIDVKSLERDGDISEEAHQEFIDELAVHAVMPLETLIGNICDTRGLTDAEVREELAEQGIDLDAAMARFRPKLDDLMRARAVRLALAAVRDNPPHDNNPLPWHFAETDEQGCDVISASEVHVGSEFYYKSAAHTCAAVNAAPVLAAEVERLTAQLEAARVAVEKWPFHEHSDYCGDDLPNPAADFAPCTCGANAINTARTLARRAVGLEG